MKRGLFRLQGRWRWLRRRLTGEKRVRGLALWWCARLKWRYHRRLAGRAMGRREIGEMGELLAMRWLNAHGRRVLYRNYKGAHRGEVDIVARHRDVLTFVEVKCRTSSAFGRPADAVGRDKQHLIQRGGMDWLRLLGRPKIRFRFDIVEVILTEGQVPHIHIIENAFQMEDSSMAGR